MSDPIVIDDLASPRLPSSFDELEADVGIGPERSLDVDELVAESDPCPAPRPRRPVVHRASWRRWCSHSRPMACSVRSVGSRTARAARRAARHPASVDGAARSSPGDPRRPGGGADHRARPAAHRARRTCTTCWRPTRVCARFPTGRASSQSSMGTAALRPASPTHAGERAELGLGLINSAMPLLRRHARDDHRPRRTRRSSSSPSTSRRCCSRRAIRCPATSAGTGPTTRRTQYRTSGRCCRRCSSCGRRATAGCSSRRSTSSSSGRCSRCSPTPVSSRPTAIPCRSRPRWPPCARTPGAPTTRRSTRWQVGVTWAGRIVDLLRASVRDRPQVPDAQVLDVRFDDFMADRWEVVEQVYELAGRPLRDDTRRRVQACMDANPRGKHGRVAYPRVPSVSTRPSNAGRCASTRSGSTYPTSTRPDPGLHQPLEPRSLA